MRAALIAMTAWVCGCFPSFDDTPYVVDSERILAVRGVPAEARPNTPVSYEALVASPEGTLEVTPLFHYCLQPRSAEERTGVSAACARGDNLEPIAAQTTILSTACTRFGPNPPPVEGGEAPRRPADPDPTGGYYLPLRVAHDDNVTFGFQRIRCDLAGATRATFEAFQDRYTDNQHPILSGITLQDEQSVRELAGTTSSVSAGATVQLSTRASADAAEGYVVYVAEESALFDRTEDLTINWYITDGALSLPSATLAPGTNATTQWAAPNQPTTVFGWVIIRDSRGGSSWLDFTLDVI